MKSINFIEEHKEMFFHWLFKVASKNFPRVCEYASDVLGCWLYVNFPDDDIEIQSGLFDGWSHSWIEIDGKVIDFTITQFIGGLNQDEQTDLSDEAFYQAYFLKYIESPFIANAELLKQYKVEEGLIVCQYGLAKWHKEKGSDFQTYLNSVVTGRW
ncbi:hypothetical protein ACFVS2_25480 [Brevibacillus sp. NPDC058079]|uniref:hypothetical protein n=1 Tax=Brevibacillus sp. NPDC058079 TaxID=3346330 RepID=UPI0036E1A57E